MNQVTQHSEKIRRYVAEVFGLEMSDESVENLVRTDPALFHLLSQQIEGKLSDARTVTDKFLRKLPNDLFDYLLVGALSFFRRGRQMSVEALLSTEFSVIALGLVIAEQGDPDRPRTDEEHYALMDRLSRLVMIEEQRRAGVFAWVAPYSLLARVDDTFPRRLPVRDRQTAH